jgi:hypothetical protein
MQQSFERSKSSSFSPLKFHTVSPLFTVTRYLLHSLPAAADCVCDAFKQLARFVLSFSPSCLLPGAFAD